MGLSSQVCDDHYYVLSLVLLFVNRNGDNVEKGGGHDETQIGNISSFQFVCEARK